MRCSRDRILVIDHSDESKDVEAVIDNNLGMLVFNTEALMIPNDRKAMMDSEKMKQAVLGSLHAPRCGSGMH